MDQAQAINEVTSHLNGWVIGGAAMALLVVIIFIALFLRRVVAPNEVHIIQSAKATTSYGKDTAHGNTYYEWPSWIPVIGITKTMLPTSVFDIRLQAYEAYDKGRVPFEVDIIAFFRISDSNLAAQRVSNFSELRTQLTSIVQGVIRTVLASHDIDEIMVERSKFGEHFTKEIETQLTNWGVVAVKNLELMDIRDSAQNKVVHNIMEKKKSLIEMQSRSEVANNMKQANIAEIDAKRDTLSQEQLALEQVGIRTAEKEQRIGIATQKSKQAIAEETKATKEREMEVVRVAEVKQAQITQQVQVVIAQQQKEVSIVKSEGEKQSTVLVAEGQLESKKRESEGVSIMGLARAEAEKAMQLAPVQAQITLAKEIGANEGYQNYLVTIRQVEANQIVGVEQAKALEAAQIKIIANTGEPVAGLKNVMDLFTPKGGTSVGGMLEAFAQTDTGAALVDKIKNNGKDRGAPNAR